MSFFIVEIRIYGMPFEMKAIETFGTSLEFSLGPESYPLNGL